MLPENSGGPKVFDVSHPRQTGPTATSKPVIVGHQPTMPDPMVSKHHFESPRPIIRPDVNESLPKIEEPVSSEPAVPQPAPPSIPIPIHQTPNDQIMPLDPAVLTGVVVNKAEPPSIEIPPATVVTEPNHHQKKTKWWLWLFLFLLVVVIGVYLAIDSGLVRGSSHLPFHIFNQN